MRYHFDGSGHVSSELYVMNADGSGVRKLTDALDPNRDLTPTLSPDWRKIAFLRNPCWAVQGACTGKSTIYVMNADGGGRHRLARGGSVRKVAGGQRVGGDDGYAWSPSGRTLAFRSDRDGHFEIYVVNADGSGERRLTHGSTTALLSGRRTGGRSRSCAASATATGPPRGGLGDEQPTAASSGRSAVGEGRLVSRRSEDRFPQRAHRKG